jgi:hypothetical protein
MSIRDLDATMRRSFISSEKQIDAIEASIATLRAEHRRAEVERLEAEVTTLIQQLVRRKAAWETLQTWVT